jgi:preprotein translocase subunit SecB
MTDTPPDVAPEQSQEATQPGLRVLAQFVRDLSFENPNAPASLRNGGAQPGIDMNVELSARAREDGLFEVDLKLSAKAARPEETVFVVELVYGGVFQIEGVGPDELEPVLLIECPRFLFPFARRLISDVTSEGGFPPFMVDPLDFAGIYAARKAQGGGSAIEAPPAGNA